MSKKRILIALVLVFLLLTGLLVYRKQTADPTGTETAPEEIILNRSADGDITRIVLSSAGGRLVLNYADESWQVEPAQPVPVSEYQVRHIVNSFKNFTADQLVLETVENWSEFGLAEPQARAELFFQDGTKKTFYLGDETPTGNGYYLRMADDSRLFTVAYRYGGNFTTTATDLRERNLPEIKTENLTYLRLVRAGQPTIEVQVPGPEGKSDGVPLGNWVMTKPYRRALTINWEKFNPVLTQITSLRIDQFIDDQPLDLGLYGLDRPWAEVWVADGENTLHLQFGATVDGKTYFKYGDQPMVFAADEWGLRFLEAKPFDLIFHFAFIENIEKVDRIVIEGAGQRYDLRLEREQEATVAEKEALSVEEHGEENAIVETFFVNGKEVTDDAFRSFYQTLIGLTVEGEIVHQPVGEGEARTTFYLNTGEQQPVVISYVPYNPDFYAVVQDGVAEFVISRDQVSRMLKEVNALAHEN